jgi:putative ABC transport system permease protein
MNPGEIIRSAFSEIRHHKLRSGLTLLGIILGTLSITVMTSFLDGVVATLWDGFADLGFDGVMYVSGRGPRDLKEQAIFARSLGLRPADAESIMAGADMIRDVAPVMISQEIVARGANERKARLMGATSSYAVVRNRKMANGRFLTPQDDESFARVCVLGHRLNRWLFGSEDAVGKKVKVAGREFRVVGVASKLGNQFVNSRDFAEEMEGLYIPLSTLRKFYIGEEEALAFIAIKTDQIDKLSQVKAELTAAVVKAHRGARDFKVDNIAEEMVRERKEVAEIIGSWKIVLGSLAGISLLVGGIGLLSVMMISIGERLYEIGLRKALGATDLQIFFQFLAESATLALVGGMLGAAGGVGITKAVAGFFPSGLPIHIGGLLAAIGISLALGIVYGIYPALKASRLEPVEALRSAA